MLGIWGLGLNELRFGFYCTGIDFTMWLQSSLNTGAISGFIHKYEKYSWISGGKKWIISNEAIQKRKKGLVHSHTSAAKQPEEAQSLRGHPHFLVVVLVLQGVVTELTLAVATTTTGGLFGLLGEEAYSVWSVRSVLSPAVGLLALLSTRSARAFLRCRICLDSSSWWTLVWRTPGIHPRTRSDTTGKSVRKEAFLWPSL